MMHATKTAASLIDEAIESMGLFAPPDRAFFREVMNECLSRLYTDILVESASATVPLSDGGLALADIPTPTGEGVREEDLLTVAIDGLDARYLPPALFASAKGVHAPFYTVSDGKILSLHAGSEARVCFVLRPPLCREGEEESYLIPLAPEFLPLLSARLCGEGFRHEGEDGLAAGRLADYNHRLSDFAVYVAAAKERRGK